MNGLNRLSPYTRLIQYFSSLFSLLKVLKTLKTWKGILYGNGFPCRPPDLKSRTDLNSFFGHLLMIKGIVFTGRRYHRCVKVDQMLFIFSCQHNFYEISHLQRTATAKSNRRDLQRQNRYISLTALSSSSMIVNKCDYMFDNNLHTLVSYNCMCLIWFDSRLHW